MAAAAQGAGGRAKGPGEDGNARPRPAPASRPPSRRRAGNRDRRVRAAGGAGGRGPQAAGGGGGAARGGRRAQHGRPAGLGAALPGAPAPGRQRRMERRGSPVLRAQVRGSTPPLCSASPGTGAPGTPTPASVQVRNWERNLVPCLSGSPGGGRDPGPPLCLAEAPAMGGMNPLLHVSRAGRPRQPPPPAPLTPQSPSGGGQGAIRKPRSPRRRTSTALAQGCPSLHMGKAQYTPSLYPASGFF